MLPRARGTPAGGSSLRELLAGGGPVIGMIHVGALPGTPRSRESVAALAERAAGEARLYA
jgi:predicted TIM-barrel enzyme